jgi:hypothetical protein
MIISTNSFQEFMLQWIVACSQCCNINLERFFYDDDDTDIAANLLFMWIQDRYSRQEKTHFMLLSSKPYCVLLPT